MIQWHNVKSAKAFLHPICRWVTTDNGALKKLIDLPWESNERLIRSMVCILVEQGFLRSNGSEYLYG